MKLRKILPALTAGLLLAGCGSDDSSSSRGHLDPEGPMYLVKSTVWTGDDGVSYHFLSNTLNETTEFDTRHALTIPEYSGILIPKGDNPENAFYVGMYNEPVIRRYVAGPTGIVTLDATLDFSGVTGQTGRNLLRATQVLSDSKAYALDFAGFQVIAFNPTDMTLIDTDATKEDVQTISIADLKEGENQVGEWSTWSVFPTTDGDRFVATMGFYTDIKDDNGDLVEQIDHGLIKLIIVDSKDHSLATDTISGDNRDSSCGAVSGAAKDADGNMYFASYDSTALRELLGMSRYKPCVVRVNTGANEFDDTYFMDMTNLGEGAFPMGAVTGTGDIGYNLILSDEGKAVIAAAAATGDLAKIGTAAKTVRLSPYWEFHSFDLTNPAGEATKVQGVMTTPSSADVAPIEGGTIGRMLSGSMNHDELGEISWMIQVDAEATGSLYNSTNTATWSLITNTIPGQIEAVGRLR